MNKADDNMRYKELGNTGVKVSVIGLGTWALGGDFFGDVNDQVSIDTVRAAIDSGINLIDTAPAYGNGHAEEIVGKAVRGLRDKVFIATKCGVVRDGEKYLKTLKREMIRKQLEDSLARLGVDTIDLYQIHWPDPETPLEDSVDELLKLKDEGKFRFLGVSNFSAELLGEIMKMTEVASLQPQYSLLSRKVEGLLEFCRRNKIGVLTYGSLGGGILSGKYREKPSFGARDRRDMFYPFFKEPLWGKSMQLVEVLKEIAGRYGKPVSHAAINWVSQNAAVTSALVGAKTPDQARENAEAGTWELSDRDIEEIEREYKRIFG